MRYRVLKKDVFLNGNYSIVPIRYEDKEQIRKWRNEQIYHLRQAKPLSEKDQDVYFTTVVASLFEQEKPSQLLFSFLKEKELIGYGGLVHINWADKNAEISFIMNTALEKEHFEEYWSIYLKLIEQVAFRELKLHKIYTYAFDLRPHLYTVLEKAGFEREAVLKEHCLFEGEYKDVVIHSKLFKSSLILREVVQTDCKLLFDWANDEEVRKNSFNPKAIEWEEHTQWFNERLNSKKCHFYIVLKNNCPIGQVRVDFQEEKWLIDYSLDKKNRSKGDGSKVISLLLQKDIRPLQAIVKKNNLPSVAIFRKFNFREEEGIINKDQVFIFNVS